MLSQKTIQKEMEFHAEISSLVDAKYYLGERIGAGQFGEIKLATCYKSGVTYACKSVHKPISKTSYSAVRMFWHSVLENIFHFITSLFIFLDETATCRYR